MVVVTDMPCAVVRRPLMLKSSLDMVVVTVCHRNRARLLVPFAFVVRRCSLKQRTASVYLVPPVGFQLELAMWMGVDVVAVDIDVVLVHLRAQMPPHHHIIVEHVVGIAPSLPQKRNIAVIKSACSSK